MNVTSERVQVCHLSAAPMFVTPQEMRGCFLSYRCRQARLSVAGGSAVPGEALGGKVGTGRKPQLLTSAQALPPLLAWGLHLEETQLKSNAVQRNTTAVTYTIKNFLAATSLKSNNRRN